MQQNLPPKMQNNLGWKGWMWRDCSSSQVSCTVPIAMNLFRGQPFEGINFSELKRNANIPHLAVPWILTKIPLTVTPHTCMISTGCPFFFFNFFASLYVSTNRCIPSNHGRWYQDFQYIFPQWLHDEKRCSLSKEYLTLICLAEYNGRSSPL